MKGCYPCRRRRIKPRRQSQVHLSASSRMSSSSRRLILRGRVSRFFLLAVASSINGARAAPPSFPESGNGMWYTAPGTTSWETSWLPIGNGYLAGMFIRLPEDDALTRHEAMLPGNPIQETTQLNIESLWSGGPFQQQVCMPLGASDLYAELHRATMDKVSLFKIAKSWRSSYKPVGKQSSPAQMVP